MPKLILTHFVRTMQYNLQKKDLLKLLSTTTSTSKSQVLEDTRNAVFTAAQN
jgi:hypothetical protein